MKCIALFFLFLLCAISAGFSAPTIEWKLSGLPETASAFSERSDGSIVAVGNTCAAYLIGSNGKLIKTIKHPEWKCKVSPYWNYTSDLYAVPPVVLKDDSFVLEGPGGLYSYSKEGNETGIKQVNVEHYDAQSYAPLAFPSKDKSTLYFVRDYPGNELVMHFTPNLQLLDSVNIYYDLDREFLGLTEDKKIVVQKNDNKQKKSYIEVYDPEKKEFSDSHEIILGKTEHFTAYYWKNGLSMYMLPKDNSSERFLFTNFYEPNGVYFNGEATEYGDIKCGNMSCQFPGGEGEQDLSWARQLFRKREGGDIFRMSGPNLIALTPPSQWKSYYDGGFIYSIINKLTNFGSVNYFQQPTTYTVDRDFYRSVTLPNGRIFSVKGYKWQESTLVSFDPIKLEWQPFQIENRETFPLEDATIIPKDKNSFFVSGLETYKREVLMLVALDGHLIDKFIMSTCQNDSWGWGCHGLQQLGLRSVVSLPTVLRDGSAIIGDNNGNVMKLRY